MSRSGIAKIPAFLTDALSFNGHLGTQTETKCSSDIRRSKGSIYRKLPKSSAVQQEMGFALSRGT